MLMCEIFQVSSSGYYEWKKRKPSSRTQANQKLDIKIKSIYKEHKRRYGAPRITKELKARAKPAV